jgi:hypothetical protein
MAMHDDELTIPGVITIRQFPLSMSDAAYFDLDRNTSTILVFERSPSKP